LFPHHVSLIEDLTPTLALSTTRAWVCGHYKMICKQSIDVYLGTVFQGSVIVMINPDPPIHPQSDFILDLPVNSDPKVVRPNGYG
jgi:hypothetical protein